MHFAKLSFLSFLLLTLQLIHARANEISNIVANSGLPAESEIYIQTANQKFSRGQINVPASLAKLWTAYGVLNSVDVSRKTPFKLTISWLESASQPGTVSSVQIDSKGSPEIDIKQILEVFQQKGVKKYRRSKDYFCFKIRKT
jgi:hypothetical protein